MKLNQKKVCLATDTIEDKYMTEDEKNTWRQYFMDKFCLDRSTDHYYRCDTCSDNEIEMKELKIKKSLVKKFLFYYMKET
jgi:hypothetical protein